MYYGKSVFIGDGFAQILTKSADFRRLPWRPAGGQLVAGRGLANSVETYMVHLKMHRIQIESYMLHKNN